MKKILLVLLIIMGYCQAAELHRIADLNQQKVVSNAGVFTKGDWNTLQIQLNGTTNPDDIDATMYGTCNIEMDKSNYSHSVRRADEGYDIHEYNYHADSCTAKVEILDIRQQEARVALSDSCQNYCGARGNIHALDGYYQ